MILYFPLRKIAIYLPAPLRSHFFVFMIIFSLPMQAMETMRTVPAEHPDALKNVALMNTLTVLAKAIELLQTIFDPQAEADDDETASFTLLREKAANITLKYLNNIFPFSRSKEFVEGAQSTLPFLKTRDWRTSHTQ